MTKAKRFLVADTETIGLAPKNLVYDFAYSIATRKDIILTREFLIREIITDPKTMLMAIDDEHWRSTFGGKLFSHYIPMLDAATTRKIFSWREVVETLREDMQTHDVSVFSAYNINFDMRALAKTQTKIRGAGKILNYRPQLLDLWLFACVGVLDTRLYHDVAHRMGWISEANNVRTTAEKAYAFLSGDFNFIESHTALADVLIETEILQRLLAKKKRIPYNEIEHMPWRNAQKVRGRLF